MTDRRPSGRPLSAVAARELAATGCEVRTDPLMRRLYATDASLYQVEPAAVAFPRSAAEAAAVLRVAAAHSLPVTARGAGTGLAGGALGEGLVVDLARRATTLSDLDLEERTVRVGPGVVLGQLNAALSRHGLWFGPDVATASRASLGGMIANDSSGSHAPVYGTTSDHVAALEVVLADGRVTEVGAERGGPPELAAAVTAVAESCADELAARQPEGLVKRWPGYGLARALRRPGDLAAIVAGSEGTLALITSAVLRIVPRPRSRTLAVVCFASVEEAMSATVELLDLAPAAIEHIDRLLYDQTRGQRAFREARELLELDSRPCEAMLLVEFFEDGDGAHVAEVERRRLGLRTRVCLDPREQELVWEVRRAGLSLLTGRPGPAKPTTCVEDVCVRPERLPEYVRGLREILGRLGLEASFYGHAASGELHLRPTLDLHTAEGVVLLRRVADEVSDLARRFDGSLAAEHGVGITRTEYLPAHLGPRLVEAMAEVKRAFDPAGVLNPGKIVDTGRWRLDRDLRLGERPLPELPLATAYGYIDKDRSFVGNLEQCNGNGACRKAAPTMCPSFRATGDELESTRGRANTIRASLEGAFGGDPVAGLASPELEAALSDCLSCKACKTECPSNVDLTLLKADLLWARHRVQGPGLLDRVVANADLLGRLGSATAPLANRLLGLRPLRRGLEWLLGLNADRPLPTYCRPRFDHWFAGRRRERTPAGRGRVLLWDDTWVRYHETGIGRAAVEVLEALGFEVGLVEDRVCCGRPAASRGLLDRVRAAGEHNLALLGSSTEPVVFLEPSCWSMFRDEYRQLELEGAAQVAERAVLFEELVDSVLAAEPEALTLMPLAARVAIHSHCHAEALAGSEAARRVLGRLPGAEVEVLSTACCGMAGAFGMLRTKDGLSRAVAAPLVAAVETLPPDGVLVAAGTSCRHQVEHLTGRRALHPAELLAAALRSS